MKVIRKGRKQTGWAREYDCTGNGNSGGGCGSTLLVEQRDLFQTSHSMSDGETDYFATFVCCECGVLTDIPGKDSPVRANNLPKRQTEHRRNMNIIDQLNNLHERLTSGRITSFSRDDYEAIVSYYGEGEIPYGVLKGRDATLEEWFADNWDYDQARRDEMPAPDSTGKFK